MSRRILESCLKKVPNKFELVLLAAARARVIAMRGGVQAAESVSGKSARHSYAKQKKNKEPYLALCEISGGVVDPSDLRVAYDEIYDRNGSLRETAKKQKVEIESEAPAVEDRSEEEAPSAGEASE